MFTKLHCRVETTLSKHQCLSTGFLSQKTALVEISSMPKDKAAVFLRDISHVMISCPRIQFKQRNLVIHFLELR